MGVPGDDRGSRDGSLGDMGVDIMDDDTIFGEVREMDKSLESCRQKIEWLEEVNKELLKACKVALLAFETMLQAKDNLCDPGQMTLLRGAIKKAEGR